ncbi:putative ARS binding protein 1 [Phytophthora cinnamomi]|uniref:putative ARS binding protein 1 n=1 Tax=Phytophthora cinnamomi TaxID=4785 RepID=UPI0035595430|nr:putative ARS binding protein 1 [Phytophthora cinnamomi]
MLSKTTTLRTGNLTQKEKRQLIEKHVREPKLTQNELREWCRVHFQLSKAPAQATISSILKRSTEILDAVVSDDRKTNHVVSYPGLDEALKLWRGGLIESSAEPPKFSNGWQATFKSRHDFQGLSRV